jgi:hypothetical protein
VIEPLRGIPRVRMLLSYPTRDNPLWESLLRGIAGTLSIDQRDKSF